MRISDWSSDVCSSDLSTQEILRFINQLPRGIGNAKLATLDTAFHWSTTGNSEIRFAWLELAIANHYPAAEASAEDFLTSQGRRKFVAPLFAELMDQPGWRSEEHTSELQSLMRLSYAVFCFKKKK